MKAVPIDLGCQPDKQGRRKIVRSKRDLAGLRNDILLQIGPATVQKHIIFESKTLEEHEWKELVEASVNFLRDRKFGLRYLDNRLQEEFHDIWDETYIAVVAKRRSPFSTGYLLRTFLRIAIRRQKKARRELNSDESITKAAETAPQFSESEIDRIIPLIKFWRLKTCEHFRDRRANWQDHWLPFALYEIPALGLTGVAEVTDHEKPDVVARQAHLTKLLDSKGIGSEKLLIPSKEEGDAAAQAFGESFHQVLTLICANFDEKEHLCLTRDNLRNLRNGAQIIDVCFGAIGIKRKLSDLRRDVLEEATRRFYVG